MTSITRVTTLALLVNTGILILLTALSVAYRDVFRDNTYAASVGAVSYFLELALGIALPVIYLKRYNNGKL